MQYSTSHTRAPVPIARYENEHLLPASRMSVLWCLNVADFRCSMQYRCTLSTFAILASLSVVAADAAVTVSQGAITLTTWDEGLPDINTWWELFPSYNYSMYPYTLRNNFLTTTANVSWRQLTVENEYLRCRVFPDLGGHLYSCLDKIANREMFYANPVVRKNFVALRGAWVGMGIEFNFPVGHTLTTVSPVSFGTQQHADGSAGVWVSDIDRKTGLEWRVEFILRPGSAVLEQDVWLYNRGSERRPYYVWSDCEVPIADLNDTFSYPVHVMTQNGNTALDSWPIGQSGRDNSVIKNYTWQTEYFAYHSNEAFFSAYHPSLKYGTAHYADVNAMPGKKLFALGPDPNSGDAWFLSTLTENFSSMIEIQAGATADQVTHIFLDPQQTRHFTEYWMPARGVDGITRVNLSGVMYVGRTNTSGSPALTVEFTSNQVVPGATLTVSQCVTPSFTASVNLDPMVTLTQNVASPNSSNCLVQLLDSNHNVLMTHTENTYDAIPPSQVTLGPQNVPDINKSDTEAEVLNRATYNEQSQNYYDAEGDYILGLQKFPSSIALRKGAGRLARSEERYDDAAALLEQVTALSPADNEAHYYLGLAYAGLGRNSAAISEWNAIGSTADFGAPAMFELACLKASTGDLTGAASLFDSLANSNPALVRAAALEIAILRRQGNLTAASNLLSRWRSISPTDLFLRYEGTLLNVPDSTLLSDLGADPERVLNLTDDYMRLGFSNDALTLLGITFPDVPANQREPGSLTPQNHPLIAYYRGYCRRQTGASPSTDYQAASGMNLTYIFPNRDSSFTVLRDAVSTNPADASAHYLLGLLYLSRRQIDNAISEWEKARALNKTLPALARNLGRTYLDVKADPASALPVLQEGIGNEPSNSDLQDAANRAQAAVQSACPYTLSSPTALAGAGASLVTVSFTTLTPSCAWTAPSFDSWITATTPVTGTGNGSVTYAIQANAGAAGRTATLTVAGRPFAITQAAPNCTSLSLTSSDLKVRPNGGTFYVGVVLPSDACTWSPSTNTSWISVSTGPGTAGVSLAIASNAGTGRVGTVSIGNRTLTVVQDGTAPRHEHH